MTPEEDLKISIEALSAYNIEPAIIRNMLVNLDKATDTKPLLSDFVNHCKKHKIAISSRIIDEFIDVGGKTCLTCGKEIMGKGYCSADCSQAAITQEIIEVRKNND